jgi:hypothetical protein
VLRRTVAEAIAQADAKDRIRTAIGVRGSGVGLLLLGLSLLIRPSTWGPFLQAVGVRIHGGPSFTLSLPAVVGIIAIGLSPFAFATGQWLLTRATAAARGNPMTAPIFEQPES